MLLVCWKFTQPNWKDYTLNTVFFSTYGLHSWNWLRSELLYGRMSLKKIACAACRQNPVKSFTSKINVRLISYISKYVCNSAHGFITFTVDENLFSIVQCTQVGSKTVCRAAIHMKFYFRYFIKWNLEDLVVIVLNFAIEEKRILIDIID